jgi:hypothetical protein
LGFVFKISQHNIKNTNIMIFTIVNMSCFISLILLIFFRTDAFLEYTHLFHLNFISHYKDFDAKRKEDIMLTYIQYLRRYHDCFFIRLITCPICQAVWWGILFGIITSLTLIPIYIVFGLMLFVIIDRLLG